MAKFQSFKHGLEELCFGPQKSKDRDAPASTSPAGTLVSGQSADAGSAASIAEQASSGECGNNGLNHGQPLRSLDISVDVNDTTFEVKRGSSRALVKDMTIPSAFPLSRDWLVLFYDSRFAPPKFFHLVTQWIVCSSVHLVHFCARLQRLADESGFTLVRVPISQIFPQPAPRWVQGLDRETDFDRPPFHPRRKIRLPPVEDPAARRRLNGLLLKSWLQPPLSFLFMFSADCRGFKAYATPGASSSQGPEYDVYQRVKGWVLADKDGFVFVALREEAIYWYDNWMTNYEERDSRLLQKKLQRTREVRHQFFKVTDDVFAAFFASEGARAAAAAAADKAAAVKDFSLDEGEPAPT